jgi:coenzyme PQQ biosynthesis protein PqqD
MTAADAALDGTRVPRLAAGVRLKHDAARGGWVLLAPERVVVLEATAVDVLGLVDGARDLDAIVDQLATEYDAAVDVIRADVRELVADLVQRGLVTA